jgi:hypothetical protein
LICVADNAMTAPTVVISLNYVMHYNFGISHKLSRGHLI